MPRDGLDEICSLCHKMKTECEGHYCTEEDCDGVLEEGFCNECGKEG